MVSKCPLTTPSSSSITAKTGVIAFVVHDAADQIGVDSISYSL